MPSGPHRHSGLRRGSAVARQAAAVVIEMAALRAPVIGSSARSSLTPLTVISPVSRRPLAGSFCPSRRRKPRRAGFSKAAGGCERGRQIVRDGLHPCQQDQAHLLGQAGEADSAEALGRRSRCQGPRASRRRSGRARSSPAQLVELVRGAARRAMRQVRPRSRPGPDSQSRWRFRSSARRGRDGLRLRQRVAVAVRAAGGALSVREHQQAQFLLRHVGLVAIGFEQGRETREIVEDLTLARGR